MAKTLNEIVKMAEQLGGAVSETDQFKSLVEVNKKVRDDADLRKLHEDYRAREEKIQKLLADKKPVEVDDKHELQRLQDELRGNDTMQELAKAEADYTQMMSKVSRGINSHLEGLLRENES